MCERRNTGGKSVSAGLPAQGMVLKEVTAAALMLLPPLSLQHEYFAYFQYLLLSLQN